MTWDMKIDPELERFIDRIVADIPRETTSAIRGVVAPVHDKAESEWPVKTGRSKRALELVTKPDAGGVRVTIQNFAENGGRQYAWAIREKTRRKNVGGLVMVRSKGRRVADLLVVRPLRQALPVAVTAIGDAIEKLWRRS